SFLLPPLSTLFPYTTLFRSRVGVSDGVAVSVAVGCGVWLGVRVAVAVSVAVGCGVSVAVLVGVSVGVTVSVAVGSGVSVGVLIGDRKSTRLNSSHVKISYAV